MPISYSLSDNNNNVTERSRVWKRLDELEKHIVQQSQFLTANDGHIVKLSIDELYNPKAEIVDAHIHNLVTETADINNINSNGLAHFANLVVDKLTVSDGQGTTGAEFDNLTVKGTANIGKLVLDDPTIDKAIIIELEAGKAIIDALNSNEISTKDIKSLSYFIEQGGRIYTTDNNDKNVMAVGKNSITIGNPHDAIIFVSNARPTWGGKNIAIMDDVQQPFTLVDAVDTMDDLPDQANNANTWLVRDLGAGYANATGLAIWLDRLMTYEVFPYYPLTSYRTANAQDIIDDEIKTMIVNEETRATNVENDLYQAIADIGNIGEADIQELKERIINVETTNDDQDILIQGNTDAIQDINDRLGQGGNFVQDIPTTIVSQSYVRKYNKDTDSKYWEIFATPEDALNKEFSGSTTQHEYDVNNAVEDDTPDILDTFIIDKTATHTEGFSLSINSTVIVDEDDVTWATWNNDNFVLVEDYDGPMKNVVVEFATTDNDDDYTVVATLVGDTDLTNSKIKVDWIKEVVTLETHLSNAEDGFVIDSTKAATMTTASERSTDVNYEITKKDIITKEYIHDNIRIVGGGSSSADTHESTITGKTLFDALNGKGGLCLSNNSTSNKMLALPQLYLYDTTYSQSALFYYFGHLYSYKISDGKYMSTIIVKTQGDIVVYYPVLFNDTGDIHIIDNSMLHAMGSAPNQDTHKMPLTYASLSDGRYCIFNYLNGYCVVYGSNDKIQYETQLTIGAGNTQNGYNLITNTNRRAHIIGFDDWFYVAIPQTTTGANSAQGACSFILSWSAQSASWTKTVPINIGDAGNQNDVDLPAALHLIKGKNEVWWKIKSSISFGMLTKDGTVSTITGMPVAGSVAVGNAAVYRRWLFDTKLLEDGRVLVVLDKSSTAAEYTNLHFLDNTGNTATNTYLNVPGTLSKYSGFTYKSIEETANNIWLFPSRAIRLDTPPTNANPVAITHEWNFGLSTGCFQINKQAMTISTKPYVSWTTDANTCHASNTRRAWSTSGNKKYLWLFPCGIKTAVINYIDYDNDTNISSVSVDTSVTWQPKTDTCAFLHNEHYLCATNSDNLVMAFTLPATTTDKTHCAILLKSPQSFKQYDYLNYGANTGSFDYDMVATTVNHYNTGLFCMGPHFLMPGTVGGLSYTSNNLFSVLYMKNNSVLDSIRWS